MSTDNGTVPNAKRLLWAGFFAIFASGVGFGVRGSILVDWAREFGFTQSELGNITGAGLTGFGYVIILGSLIADRIGYAPLMISAIVMAVLSVALQAFAVLDKSWAYLALYWAMIVFSISNGICEVVVNPMVAALFPKDKTHYLNILHAGWPGGLITGGLIGYVMNDMIKVHWMFQMSLFLVPVAIYAFMLLGQHMPTSEAGQAGVSFATMLAEFAVPLLLLLMLIQAMVGYVELGTDSWISKITGTIFASRGGGMLLFVYTSGLMFALRFCAGPIVHRLSPLGLLFCSAVLASIGLTLLSYGTSYGQESIVLIVITAVTIYGLGKTFFWPTMLAVVSERFPRGGAVTMGAVGGIGMLSAGYLGSPGIGHTQDHYATVRLEEEAPDTARRYTSSEKHSFYGLFPTEGLDGAKKGLLDLYEGAQKGDAKSKIELKNTLEKLRASTADNDKALISWWDAAEHYADKDGPPVKDSDLFGGLMALRWTAFIPATMAVLYLLLILYFRTQGGYKRLEVKDEPPSPITDLVHH